MNITDSELQQLCFGVVLTNALYIGNLRNIFVFSIGLIFVITKIAFNRKFLLKKNIIFSLYFGFVLIGLILLLISAILFSYSTTTLLQSPLIFAGSVMSGLGFVMVDTFFGLIPYFLYSLLLNTNMNSNADHITKKYFIFNFCVIGIFFLIFFCLCFATESYVWVIDTVFDAQILYTIFFIITFLELRKMDKKGIKSLSRYFMYYMAYACAMIPRNILLVLIFSPLAKYSLVDIAQVMDC